ncbi:MAG: lipopolysaccharide heptosyltransferase I [Rhodocyclaceae bacterium]|nr:MAG: lipopolysaccharide heptosyltransferase I [Rhodocyclaceae bacterium]
MRILIVKTSSLGDVIHNLPVVTDIRRQWSDAAIDWCVEESFSAIPRLHPGVGRVLPVAVRRWRKHLFDGGTWSEMGALRRSLRERDYDAVLDTQGLVKSALIASQAIGPKLGYDAASAREPMAARLYDRHASVSRQLHAVVRNRELAAKALGYTLSGDPDYGIAAPAARFDWLPSRPSLVFLTATSRDDKLWPEDHWVALGEKLAAEGFLAVLPAGNPVERQRAARLAKAIPGAIAAPAMKLPELATLLDGARGVVGVDTGLSHLAVALSVPTVALYTATEPGLTGVLGPGFHRNLGGKGQTPAVSQVIDALTPVLS